jgi:hypothetical protein
MAYHTQRKLDFPDPECLANCVARSPVISANTGVQTQ